MSIEELAKAAFDHGWLAAVAFRARSSPGWLAHLYRRIDRDKPQSLWGDGWIYGEGDTAVQALQAAYDQLLSVEPLPRKDRAHA
jgi:hypothetical protein